jgi:hypothetical protein
MVPTVQSAEKRYLNIKEVFFIHPSSVLAELTPQWVLYEKSIFVIKTVINTSKPFMVNLTVIEPAWLVELAPTFYNFKTNHKVLPF